MPKRDDISSVLVIGSGPAGNGPGRELDYLGSQACRALDSEGVRVCLVNPNPATIMTDPAFADATYVEPITVATLEKVIAIERPDALLATVGGQAALDIAVELAEAGILGKYRVEPIGASIGAIRSGTDRARFRELVAGLGGEVMAEDSLAGWKEFGLELMRDATGTAMVVCSTEDVDPMGGRPGDSVTVAPAMTLTGGDYQRMREVAFGIAAAAAGAAGSGVVHCGIRFGADPRTGRMAAIGMSPRMSRSSALASKATGYPIGAVAARLALGYTLDEITGFTTGEPASAEPGPGHVAVRAGGAMAIGQTFGAALQKAQRSLDSHRAPFSFTNSGTGAEALLDRCRTPHDGRLRTVQRALLAGATVRDAAAATGIDPWFVDEIVTINSAAERIIAARPLDRTALRAAKSAGFSDAQIAQLRACAERQIRESRWELGLRPVYRMTAPRAHPARPGSLYSAYAEGIEETEVPGGGRRKVIILGAGPHPRPESDYACAHACAALAEVGYETVMVNCGPGMACAGRGAPGRLYVEPLTLEDVLEVVHAEQRTGPVAGVIAAMGGQAALSLARELAAAGVPVAGTGPAVVGPSVAGAAGFTAPAPPIACPATEVGVVALYDGAELYLGGALEHIEEDAGPHWRDSARTLPPVTLGRDDIDRIRAAAEAIAAGAGVRGLLSLRCALAGSALYVLEASPQAARDVPFVTKATGTPLARAAARIMLGATIADLRTAGLLPAAGDGGTYPPDAPVTVGNARVMGIDATLGAAYAKFRAAARGALPATGTVFVSVADRDKRAMIFPVKRLADLGFDIRATAGTAHVLGRNGVRATVVTRIGDGEADLIVTAITGLAAAVQGIEAVIRGEVAVQPLQHHSKHLQQSMDFTWGSDGN